MTVVAVAVTACTAAPSTSDGGALDATGPDGASDAGPADATPDAPSFPPCNVAAPMVAGTTETDALANAAARCGAPPHAWLRDATLGDVVAHHLTERYTPDQLATLATVNSIMLPEAPMHSVRIERVAYVTQDRGALVQSSMAMAFPTDLDTRTEVPVLLFLHGTSGFTHGCGPSVDPTSRIIAGLLASYGWVVAAPDYLGLESDDATAYGALHPYLIGEATAIASLDAARAAARRLALDHGAVCAATRLAVFGGSQGGHAALWVDRLAPYYARELVPIGGVATVPPADLVAEGQRALTSVVPATDNTIAMLVTQPVWYGAGARIGEALTTARSSTVPGLLATSCDAFDMISASATLADDFQQPLLDAATAGTFDALDPFGCYARENGLVSTDVARIGVDGPSYGILFVLGENDDLVNPAIERHSYDTLCAAGMPLTYLECAGAGHVDTTYWAVPEILDFLTARRDGTPFTPQCTRAAATRCRGTP